MNNMLDNINCPEDLRKLDPGQLSPLCREIRDYIIECCSTNPGHLGSSLGAVELIVGLHYVYNTPFDKIVFDVGHQAYAHKILTGRREAFRKNRMRDGLSGFPNRAESEYDIFGTGHSSTSISAALGLSSAARLRGSGEKVVALLGDGALTGGLALEGLNNAGASRSDILIILNDNNISIDKNTGGIHNHLLRLTTDPKYLRLKDKIWDGIGEGHLRDRMQKIVRSTKSSILGGGYHGPFFEALGFRYFGPIDGNDIDAVVDALKRLREIRGPRILHTITKKGKGYLPAESDPTVWHAPGRFNVDTGLRIKTEHRADRYQDVFGEVLVDLARKDSRIVGVTPAMASGCGMNVLAREIPERFFDVGIEEEHAVTFSAGLAAGGMKPFCNIYSSFSQRAYDGIIHDVALQNLPVVLCFDRAGLVGEDGATHHGAFDMAALRPVPNLTICSPMDEQEMRHMMYTAQLPDKGPFVIRYPRGRAEHTEWRCPMQEIPVGKARCLKEGRDIALLSLGPLGNLAAKAITQAEEEAAAGGRTLSVAHYDMRFLKPLDEALLHHIAQHFSRIVTLEDGVRNGGLGSAVLEFMAEHGYAPRVTRLGLPDSFVEHGTVPELQRIAGIDKESITRVLLE